MLQCLQAARRLLGLNHSPPCEVGVLWSSAVALVVHPGSCIWQVLLSLVRIRVRSPGGHLYWGLAMWGVGVVESVPNVECCL